MVVRLLEGDFSPVPCLNENGISHRDESCDLASCGIKLVMTDVKYAIASVLDKTALSDMLERSETARLIHANSMDYSI
jgi:DNA-binding IscR family transcriptional regulator